MGKLPIFCFSKFDLTLIIKLMQIIMLVPVQYQQLNITQDQLRHSIFGNHYGSFGLKGMMPQDTTTVI